MSADKQTRIGKTRKKPSDFQRLGHRFMSGLLRSLFLVNNTKRFSETGFVLPTTVLLLLVVSLTVGAMSFRTFSRTAQTIAYRNQEVIDNLAAPAIDRAKSKIEFLLTQDASVSDKKPPSSTDLLSALAAPAVSSNPDPYTIPDETRIDANSDGVLDNVWSFNALDGTKIVYSIILDDTTDDGTISISNANDQDKANNFIVRNGPIDTTTPAGSCPVARLAGNGWQLSGTTMLAKNIQVDILAIKGTGPSKTVSAAEYQQVRTAARGNRWGAWFRYDMEIFPGSPLRWNGAMHTEGSLFADTGFVAYMVSSPKSCIYDDQASVIEVSGSLDTNKDGTDDFQGQLVSGVTSRSGNASFTNDAAIFHTNATATDTTYGNGGEKLSADNSKPPRDSVTPKNGESAANILQNPIKIFTEDDFVHNDRSKWDRYPNWETTGQISRVKNDVIGAVRPFVDDGYRADNRYGPKPRYNKLNSLSQANSEANNVGPHKVGEKITDNNLLITDAPNTEDYGLDGYWERSATATGLRIIAGQRLELGNTFGWGGNDDPLYPPNSGFSNMKKTIPATLIPPAIATTTDLKGTAETLQMRSLRDNLAAVQSIAIYHSADPSTLGRYPIACLASTVHPGTADSLERSRTFDKYKYADTKWKTDFLTGNGTNGMEFAPPPASDFNASTGVIATKWVDALKNLAYFAGDPKGGAPSFPAVQRKAGAADGFVHPYPYMSMWGDFSILRRLFTDTTFNYAPATNYNALSIADKSTIHTAACTLGMLAYNIDARKSEETAILNAPNSSINWTNLGVKLSSLVVDNNSTNFTIIGRPILGASNYKSAGVCKSTGASAPNYSNPNWTGCPSKNPNDVTDTSDPEHPQNYFSRFSTEEWIVALGLNDDERKIINALSESTQILRDRTLGFKTGSFTGDLSGNFKPDTGIWTIPVSGDDEINAGALASGDTFKLGCDPRYFSQGQLSGSSSRSRLGLALVLCSVENKPKYPALYYVFPKVDHSQVGTGSHAQPTTTEEFFSTGNNYITGAGVNGTGDIYKAVDVSTIALTPYAPYETGWKLPKVDVTPVTAPGAATPFEFSEATTSAISYTDASASPPTSTAKNLSQNIIKVKAASGSGFKFYRTALLDKAMMDGRELLNVRLTDLDISLLTSNTINGSAVSKATAEQVWIPASTGIVYAFREDAKREDAIVRPFDSTHSDAATAWSTCGNMSALTTNAKCYMSSLASSTPQDPPLNNATGISPKPVDIFPDPERRPYGFRLINGKSFNRAADSANDPVFGMTFVTDNTVYIRGDFNLHAVKGSTDLETNLLEEFKGTGNLLGSTFSDYSFAQEQDARKLFYGRDNLDNRFSDPSKDNWRPVEIFADGISILSDIFIDGWIEDYFVTASPDTVDSTRGKPIKNSSYLNSNRPWFRDASASEYATGRWLHENNADTKTPIHVGRNGKIRRKVSTGTGDFVEFPKDSGGENISFYVKTNNAFLFRARQPQQPTPNLSDPVRVNALLVSGIIPSREGQSYGGLHNFPRLLEYWPSRQLVISGGFFQLNFSSQAVAPFDQDAWEPGTASKSGNPTGEIGSTGNQNESNFFYGSAKRIWGYDVGFQYTPAGPISRRFFRLERPRSEFYRELPVDDPYINQLCAAAGGNC